MLPFQAIVCCVALNNTDSHNHFGKTRLECAKLHILTTRNVDILVLNVLLAKKNAPRMGTIFFGSPRGVFFKALFGSSSIDPSLTICAKTFTWFFSSMAKCLPLRLEISYVPLLQRGKKKVRAKKSVYAMWNLLWSYTICQIEKIILLYSKEPFKAITFCVKCKTKKSTCDPQMGQSKLF